MNHSFYGADQATYRQVLLISLIAATLVSGIIVETGARATGRGQLAKAANYAVVRAIQASASTELDLAVLD
jgi:hypothetical protein